MIVSIKDWISTNGAFIAGVLATNQLAEKPELQTNAEGFIYITNLVPTNFYVSNIYTTNILQASWVTNTVNLPVEHWYQEPIQLWLALSLVCAASLVVYGLMTAIRNIRGEK